MTDDKKLDDCQLDDESDVDENESEEGFESRAGAALYGETEKDNVSGPQAASDLKNLLHRINVSATIRDCADLIRHGLKVDATAANAIPSAGIAFLGARRMDFIGYDSNGLGAVVGKPGGTAVMSDLIALTESNRNQFSALSIGSLPLFADRLGQVYRSDIDEGTPVLHPTALRLVPSSRPDLLVKTFGGADSAVVTTEVLRSVVTSDGAMESNRAPRIDYRALVQSNDYATTGTLEGPIEDGFRTAGRNRTFDGNGKFAATDRAAIVIDRNSDPKLLETLKLLRETDERLKATGAAPQQRAEALSRMVRTLMVPEGKTEQQLDQEYRRFMKENGGKEVRLGDLIGSGSCAPASLLLKLAADDLGFDCALVRGNNGTHVWTTFKFDGETERRIFDVKADSYSAPTSDSRFHRPDPPTSARAEFAPGQAVTFDGQDWTVSGIDSHSGAVNLERNEKLTVPADEAVRQNVGKQLQIGETFSLTDTAGVSHRWVLQGVQPDGKLLFSRKEAGTVSRTERAAIDSPIELAAGADLLHLRANWATLVGNNSLLSPARRAELAVARENLVNEPASRQAEFRTLIDELATIEKTKPANEAHRAELKAKAEAIAKIAEVSGKFPKVVNIPVERINANNNLTALQSIAKSLAESAPFLKEPGKADGRAAPPKNQQFESVYTDGKAFEYRLGQAFQEALRDTATIKQLIASKKFPPGDWVFVPTAPGSALDHMKCDGIMFDLSTGKALFFDFSSPAPAPGQRELYGAYREKLGQGEPWAFSIDRDHIGFDRRSGKKTYTLPVDKRAVLEHIGQFAEGKLPQHLGLTGQTQPKPDLVDVADLTKKLGELPSARPVDGTMEAQVLTREEGKTVRSTAQELADHAAKLSAETARSANENALLNGARDASRFATDLDACADKLQEGLRAAVEADKFGTTDLGFGGSKNPNPTIIKTGIDSTEGCPHRYRDVDYVAIEGGSIRTPAVEVRLYPNGEIVFVQTDGRKSKYLPMGKVGDFGDKALKQLVELGYDPADYRTSAKKFGQMKFPVDFVQLQKDIRDLQASNITKDVFWAKYAELRLLAGSVHYGNDQSRAARDGRPVYEAVDVHPTLGSMTEAEKQAFTKKTVRLQQAQTSNETKLTVDDVKSIQEMEKAGKLTEHEAAKLYKEMGSGRSEADLKAAAELFERMKENYKPAGKTAPKLTPEGVGQIYARYGAISDATIGELSKLGAKMKGQTIADVMAQVDARPLIERTQGVWKDMEFGALPKELSADFLACMDDALASMKKEGLDAATAARYEDMVERYRAQVENTAAQPDAMPKNIHDFFESARRTGAVGERVWQVPQALAPAERDLFERRLAKFGENPLSKPGSVAKFSALIDAETAKWAEDLQGRARRVTDLNSKLQEAHRAAYEQALKESASPAEATKLLQSDGGSKALKELRGQWKMLNEEHSKATTELSKDCRTRAEALQVKVNEFAKTHGLPPVQIKVVEHLNGAGGHYVRGNGEFRVTTADMLNPRTGAELAGVLYHELVHLQQDNLIFRKILDDLKIKELSADANTRAEQLKQIRERYNFETGARLPEPSTTETKTRWEVFVADVATERGGKPLGATERSKADVLAKSFKENSPLGLRFQETADAVRVLENEQRRLSDRSTNRVAEDLISRLAAEGREGELLRKQFFGDKPSGPLYEMVEEYRKTAKDSSGRATTWDETAARKAVADHIDGVDGKDGRIDALNAERQAIYRKYARPLFEQEATVLGNKVHSLETRNVMKAAYEGTPSGGEKTGTESGGKEGGDKKPAEQSRPGVDEALNEIPVQEKERRSSDPLAKDKPLDVKSLEGPNGLKILADRLAEPKLMEKLKEYDNDAKFREMFEKKIKEAKGKDKEKLEKEYEQYKKLGEGQQELVRRSVIAEAVEAHLAKARGREWMRTGEKVLGTAGTFIAVFMLAELILSEAKSGSSSSKPAAPTVK
ncbi:MAG: hypothetical protein K2W95_04095 [Candidatus Obscuribacterales bacterium]|nr:hypothetical protein [Candidatus Obscuribacterales bacterium]